MTATFVSLFAGIGGIDLGLERAGWTCVGQVENDPFCQAVLAKHWPDVPRWSDIHDLDPAGWTGIDLIAGGFPCQPVSSAGKQRAQADERWLWPEFARIVRAVRPRWVLVENVPHLLSVVEGRAAQEVIGDLSRMGYDTEWFVLSAAEMGAPHLRRRVFIIAHTVDRPRLESGWVGGSDGPDTSVSTDDGLAESLAHPEELAVGTRLCQDRSGPGWVESSDHGGNVPDSDGGGFGQQWRTGPVLQEFATTECDRRWSPEPDVGRVADGVPLRVDRLRGLGNAVVPRVAEEVGRRIFAVHEQKEIHG